MRPFDLTPEEAQVIIALRALPPGQRDLVSDLILELALPEASCCVDVERRAIVIPLRP